MRNASPSQRSPLLSVTSEYALRAILVLAQDPTRPMRADEIAAAIGAPRNYLAKTLNSLAKAKITTSTRGPLGGFMLAVSSETLTVGDIAAVFDPTVPRRRCLLRDQPCDPENPCSAHTRWADVSEAARQAMLTTIAELLAPPLAPESAF
jgi:Rrf2 family protein